MNLTDEELKELNILLKNSNLDLPKFRREVNRTGNNFAWLQRNISFRNKNLSKRLLHLLRLRESLSTEVSNQVKPSVIKTGLAIQNEGAYNKGKI